MQYLNYLQLFAEWFCESGFLLDSIIAYMKKTRNLDMQQNFFQFPFLLHEKNKTKQKLLIDQS